MFITKTFILYQTEFPIKLNDVALFEISIMEDEIFSNLELPLTTMKIKINKKNLNHIFQLIHFLLHLVLILLLYNILQT